MNSFDRKNILIILVAIYLGLGPVTWFAGFGFGMLKRVLLVLIVLLFLPDVFGKTIKGVGKVIVLFFFLGISLWVNYSGKNDYTSLIIGLIENLLFFIIGYRFIQKGFLTGKVLKIVVSILAFFCIFTISNAIIGIPDWYTPYFQTLEESLNRSLYEYDKLWSTGFSWSRAGWGCSICLYLPICIPLIRDIKNRSLGLICSFLIFVSLLICGCRSGLVGVVLSMGVILYALFRNKKAVMIKALLFIAIVIIALVFSNSLLEHFRIGTGDVSAGRLEQYEKIPQLISLMPFWGFGDGTLKDWFEAYIGQQHTLHNTYARSLIEYGWLYGITLLFITLYIIKYYLKAVKARIEQPLIFSSVLITGLVAALFEPALIVGYLGGYCLWWFAFGVFSYYINNQVNHKINERYGNI